MKYILILLLLFCSMTSEVNALSNSENIAKQTETTYEQYKKIKSLVDLGYFLENYIVTGGVVTKDVTQNNYINVTEIVVSLDNDVTRREATSFKTKVSNTTYYLDYMSSGDFHWDTSHYSGSYLPIAQVTTDANKNVLLITDMRGTVGGFRLKPGYMYPEITALQEATAQHGILMPYLGNYAINLKMTNFPVLTANRRAQKTYDREIIFLGDSHGWGQGSPDNDFVTFYSRFMTFPYNKGFFARLAEHIENKYQFYKTSIIPFSLFGNLGSNEISQISPTDTEGVNKDSDTIHPLVGMYAATVSNVVTPVDATGFYNPSVNTDNASAKLGYLAFQNKLSRGMIIMGPELSQSMYRTLNKYDSLEIIPNGRYDEPSFTQYKSNGGFYYGFSADKSSQIIHTAEKVLPDWLIEGRLIYIPGYGEVKISAIGRFDPPVFGVNLALKLPNGSSIPDDLSPYLYAGAKIYKSRIGKSMFYINMKEHARRIYVGIQKGVNGGRVEIFFSDENTGIATTDNDFVTKSNTPNIFYPIVPGFPKVYKVVDGVDTLLSTPEVVITGSSITIDTYNVTDKEVVYCLDYGMQQKGRLYFNYAGANGSAINHVGTGGAPFNSPVIKIRGIIFDGNVARNFSMGGRTVGQWLLDDDATPHIGELLNYVPRTPTLSVIQAPIVNEYLLQTPIATFKNNLALLTTKLNNHKNSGGAKKTDFLFFTTVGDQYIEFNGAASLPITYNQYFQAIREFCITNNYGFIDFQQYFKDSVRLGLIDAPAIYDDTIHPSPFANEFISDGLKRAIDLIM